MLVGLSLITYHQERWTQKVWREHRPGTYLCLVLLQGSVSAALQDRLPAYVH